MLLLECCSSFSSFDLFFRFLSCKISLYQMTHVRLLFLNSSFFFFFSVQFTQLFWNLGASLPLFWFFLFSQTAKLHWKINAIQLLSSRRRSKIYRKYKNKWWTCWVNFSCWGHRDSRFERLSSKREKDIYWFNLKWCFIQLCLSQRPSANCILLFANNCTIIEYRFAYSDRIIILLIIKEHLYFYFIPKEEKDKDCSNIYSICPF